MVVSCYIVFIGILALNFIYIIIGIVLIWSNFKGILAILKHQQRSLKIYVFGNIMLIVLSFVIWSSVRAPGRFTISDLYVIIPVLILIISTYCAVTVKVPISPQLERTPTPPIEDNSTIIRPPKYEDIPITSTYDDLPPPYTITALAMPVQSIPTTITTTATTTPIINTQLNLGETTHTQVPLQQVIVTQIVQQQQSASVDMSDRNRDNNDGANDLNGNGNTSNIITTQISNDIQ